MKTFTSRSLSGILPILLTAVAAPAAIVTNDTLVGINNTNFDGLDIVVTNATLTVDGNHTFAGVHLLNGSRLTHSFATNGLLENRLTITNELHTMSATNPAALNYENALTNTIVVTDLSGSIYQQGTDYGLTVSNATSLITLLPGSAIGEGATVAVNYDALLAPVPAGLRLAISNDFEIELGASIDLKAKGFGGGQGPGAGGSSARNYPYPFTAGGGGGHGGYGAPASTSQQVAGNSYGSLTGPADLGSGGGTGSGVGGAGGGAADLTVGGLLRVDGLVLANGAAGANFHSGGGAGGGIRLSAQTFAGSGSISADGGAGESPDGGGGAGGRVSIIYGTNSFAGLLSARGGASAINGGAGTIYTAALNATTGQVVIDNGGAKGANTLLALSNTLDLRVSGGAIVNPVPLGGIISSLLLGSNSWIVPSTSQALMLSVSGDAIIQPGAGFNGDGAGYSGGGGRGAGHSTSSTSGITGGGGSYGGYGGPSAFGAGGGNYYGSASEPTDLGSGGGIGAGSAPYNAGGAGGGALHLIINGTLTLDGHITANGLNGTGQGSGGGSGGSVWLNVGSLQGAGAIMANGGPGEMPLGGGGGGGRIAIYYSGTNNFSGTIAARGAIGANNGSAGTIYSKARTNSLAQVVIDNGGLIATNTILALQAMFDLNISGRSVVTYPGGAFGPLGSLMIQSNSWLAFSNLNNSAITMTISSNATIQAGSGITLAGAGSPVGQGPGAGRPSTGSGGGYGGYGGNSATNTGGGNIYGSVSSPREIGSGGGTLGNLTLGGAGGGGLYLTVSGTLSLDGKITADGSSALAQGCGGGSGGALWLSAGQISGAGLISANGGLGGLPTGGGGGGGRIALYYGTNQFAGTLSAHGGAGANFGGAGTIFLSPTKGIGGQLIVDNAGARGTNTIVSQSPAVVSFANLTVTGGANAYSTLLSSLGNLTIASNSTLTYSNRSAVVSATNVVIQAGGALIMDGMGFGPNAGPGAGRSLYSQTHGYTGGGGGYGGYGGNGFVGEAPSGFVSAAGGNSYGTVAEPVDAGSGGGGEQNLGGGAGGGVLRLNVTGTLTVDGSLTANGRAAPGPSGGGSGGSLWLTVGALSGAGVISANGGAGSPLSGGGGGGGRISISYLTNRFTGPLSARGGPGVNFGGAGTIYMLTRYISGVLPQVAQVLVDNGGQRGTNTTLTGSQYDLTVSGGSVVNASSSQEIQLFVHNLVVKSNSWITSGTNQTLQISASGTATFQAGGGITVDGRGSPEGRGLGAGGAANTPTFGPSGGGGGYGGYGGSSIDNAAGGNSYGSIMQPTDAGSGGGSISSPLGGSGGGSIKLSVIGPLLLDGTASASGANAPFEGGGGGSGGSIWITAGSLSGGGNLLANGGAGDFLQGGGGAGGRIAVYAGSNQFSGTIEAYGGMGAVSGGAGTIYSKAANEPVGHVIVDNGGVVGTNTPLTAPEAFGLTVSGSAVVHPSGAPLLFSSLLLDSGGTLTHLATQTNLEITVFGNAVVQTNGVIFVDAKGYNGADGGPGAGLVTNFSGSGAGYGGAGGASATGAPGGPTYGSPTQPVDRGSRGGLSPAYPDFCQGGGAILLRVSSNLTVNGSISANGKAALVDGAGGGAGGSVWLTARQFDGFGLITANGGQGEDSGGGGGGGGRIAINARTNSFAGAIYAAGGLGANPGQDGTVLVTNIPAPQIVAQTPSGIVYSFIDHVDLTFGSLMNFSTAASGDFSLDTPIGLVPPSNFALSPTGLTNLRLSFPAQSSIGYYEIHAGPQIEDIYGQPMSTAYIGDFIILPPTISGRVTDANGQPVPFVTIRPDGGLLPEVTDTQGAYSLQVPPAWTGTLVPVRGTGIFIPEWRSFSNVSANLTNQNFILADPSVLTLGIQGQASNLNLAWNGLNGVSYQVLSTTNLVDWMPYGGVLLGTNGPMSLSIPAGPEPMKFFRFQTAY
jgi:hypothetical protein